MRNMDEEEKKLYILKDNSYYKTEGDRVYHINVVLKLSHNKEEFYKRFRVIITQNGIKRIEDVAIDKYLLN
jgi:hypothetical protein